MKLSSMWHGPSDFDIKLLFDLACMRAGKIIDSNMMMQDAPGFKASLARFIYESPTRPTSTGRVPVSKNLDFRRKNTDELRDIANKHPVYCNINSPSLDFYITLYYAVLQSLNETIFSVSGNSYIVQSNNPFFPAGTSYSEAMLKIKDALVGSSGLLTQAQILSHQLITHTLAELFADTPHIKEGITSRWLNFGQGNNSLTNVTRNSPVVAQVVRLFISTNHSDAKIQLSEESSIGEQRYVDMQGLLGNYINVFFSDKGIRAKINKILADQGTGGITVSNKDGTSNLDPLANSEIQIRDARAGLSTQVIDCFEAFHKVDVELFIKRATSDISDSILEWYASRVLRDRRTRVMYVIMDKTNKKNNICSSTSRRYRKKITDLRDAYTMSDSGTLISARQKISPLNFRTTRSSSYTAYRSGISRADIITDSDKTDYTQRIASAYQFLDDAYSKYCENVPVMNLEQYVCDLCYKQLMTAGDKGSLKQTYLKCSQESSNQPADFIPRRDISTKCVANKLNTGSTRWSSSEDYRYVVKTSSLNHAEYILTESGVIKLKNLFTAFAKLHELEEALAKASYTFADLPWMQIMSARNNIIQERATINELLHADANVYEIGDRGLTLRTRYSGFKTAEGITEIEVDMSIIKNQYTFMREDFNPVGIEKPTGDEYTTGFKDTTTPAFLPELTALANNVDEWSLNSAELNILEWALPKTLAQGDLLCIKNNEERIYISDEFYDTITPMRMKAILGTVLAMSASTSKFWRTIQEKEPSDAEMYIEKLIPAEVTSPGDKRTYAFIGNSQNQLKAFCKVGDKVWNEVIKSKVDPKSAEYPELTYDELFRQLTVSSKARGILMERGAALGCSDLDKIAALAKTAVFGMLWLTQVALKAKFGNAFKLEFSLLDTLNSTEDILGLYPYDIPAVRTALGEAGASFTYSDVVLSEFTKNVFKTVYKSLCGACQEQLSSMGVYDTVITYANKFLASPVDLDASLYDSYKALSTASRAIFMLHGMRVFVEEYLTELQSNFITTLPEPRKESLETLMSAVGYGCTVTSMMKQQAVKNAKPMAYARYVRPLTKEYRQSDNEYVTAVSDARWHTKNDSIKYPHVLLSEIFNIPEYTGSNGSLGTRISEAGAVPYFTTSMTLKAITSKNSMDSFLTACSIVDHYAGMIGETVNTGVFKDNKLAYINFAANGLILGSDNQLYYVDEYGVLSMILRGLDTKFKLPNPIPEFNRYCNAYEHGSGYSDGITQSIQFKSYAEYQYSSVLEYTQLDAEEKLDNKYKIIDAFKTSALCSKIYGTRDAALAYISSHPVLSQTKLIKIPVEELSYTTDISDLIRQKKSVNGYEDLAGIYTLRLSGNRYVNNRSRLSIELLPARGDAIRPSTSLSAKDWNDCFYSAINSNAHLFGSRSELSPTNKYILIDPSNPPKVESHPFSQVLVSPEQVFDLVCSVLYYTTDYMEYDTDKHEFYLNRDKFVTAIGKLNASRNKHRAMYDDIELARELQSLEKSTVEEKDKDAKLDKISSVVKQRHDLLVGLETRPNIASSAEFLTLLNNLKQSSLDSYSRVSNFKNTTRNMRSSLDLRFYQVIGSKEHGDQIITEQLKNMINIDDTRRYSQNAVGKLRTAIASMQYIIQGNKKDIRNSMGIITLTTRLRYDQESVNAAIERLKKYYDVYGRLEVVNLSFSHRSDTINFSILSDTSRFDVDERGFKIDRVSKEYYCTEDDSALTYNFYHTSGAVFLVPIDNTKAIEVIHYSQLEGK